MNDLRQRLIELRDRGRNDPISTKLTLADLDTLAEAVNELAQLQEGSQNPCCCYSEDCPTHGTEWHCGDCGKTWEPGVLSCPDCDAKAEDSP